MTAEERCADCIALVEGENGEWICDECGKNIYDVEECLEWGKEN